MSDRAENESLKRLQIGFSGEAFKFVMSPRALKLNCEPRRRRKFSRIHFDARAVPVLNGADDDRAGSGSL
jgi:hypothetical protein